MRTTWAVLTLLLFTLASAAGASPDGEADGRLLEVREIADLGGSASFGEDVNNQGLVVGYADNPERWGYLFDLDTSELTVLDVFGEDTVEFEAINDAGLMAGEAGLDGVGRPVLQDAGTGEITLLGLLPDEQNYHVRDMNQAGVVVGGGWGGSPNSGVIWLPPEYLAFSLGEGHSAEAVNEGGTVVGNTHGDQAFVYEISTDEFTYFQIGTSKTVAYGVNDDDLVVGWFRASGSGPTQTFIHDLDGDDSGSVGLGYLTSINEDGVVAGSDGDDFAFVERLETGERITFDTLPGVSVAANLNERGDVVGRYRDDHWRSFAARVVFQPGPPDWVLADGCGHPTVSWHEGFGGYAWPVTYSVRRDGVEVGRTLERAFEADPETARADFGIVIETSEGTTVETDPVPWADAAALFDDVAELDPFCSEIGWGVAHDVVDGYGDGTFRPRTVTSRMVVAALLFRLHGDAEYVPPAIPTFTDVPVWHPFYREIEWLAAADLTTGFPDGSFRPRAGLTRGGLSAFLFRLTEPDFAPPSEVTFADVPTGHAFFAAVEWMAANDLASGYEDGRFRPDHATTRQSTIALLCRYIRLELLP